MNTDVNTYEVPNMQVQLLHPHARMPMRSTTYSAGYDLVTPVDVELPAHSIEMIGLGIAIRIPHGREPYRIYGSIRSRSGLFAKQHVECFHGVIDEDYSNEVRVILKNHSDEVVVLPRYTRVAQLVLEVHVVPNVSIVDVLSPIETNRSGGFGSTGL